mmetsp:Transcript_30375/g.54372  ORF Transcript_30375/g.54372 Transcript_30375/m.54372 type:complete len:238 (-) Transcript_30375:2696-3409(-)
MRTESASRLCLYVSSRSLRSDARVALSSSMTTLFSASNCSASRTACCFIPSHFSRPASASFSHCRRFFSRASSLRPRFLSHFIYAASSAGSPIYSCSSGGSSSSGLSCWAASCASISSSLLAASSLRTLKSSLRASSSALATLRCSTSEFMNSFLSVFRLSMRRSNSARRVPVRTRSSIKTRRTRRCSSGGRSWKCCRPSSTPASSPALSLSSMAMSRGVVVSRLTNGVRCARVTMR